MTRINDLSTISGSTNTNSVLLWAVWNGKDYKVPFTDLANLVGRNGGTLFQLDGNEGPGNGVILPVGSVQYDQNDFFDANSIGVCYIKNDRVTHIKMQGCFFSNDSGAAWYLYKNGAICSSLAVEPGENGADDMSLVFQSPELAVDSGDRFDFRPFDNGGDIILADRSFWNVYPTRYKE